MMSTDSPKQGAKHAKSIHNTMGNVHVEATNQHSNYVVRPERIIHINWTKILTIKCTFQARNVIKEHFNVRSILKYWIFFPTENKWMSVWFIFGFHKKKKKTLHTVKTTCHQNGCGRHSTTSLDQPEEKQQKYFGGQAMSHRQLVLLQQLPKTVENC